MTSRRSEPIAVTGLGVISPIGSGLESFRDALFEGRSAGRVVTGWDTSQWRSRIACPVVDFDPSAHLDKREVRRLDRAGQFGLVAASMALVDAGLWAPDAEGGRLTGVDPDRVAVVTGTCAPMEWVWLAHEACFTRGPRHVPPTTVLATFCDAAAARISIRYGLTGPCHTVSTACASAADAFGLAFWLLDTGRVDVVLAGGIEAPIVPSAMIAFGQARALSERNETPESASRPFARDRDGFVMGEGAGLLVLEREAHARARGARLRGRLAGHAATCDATHMTNPAPDGLQRARAMRLALEAAELSTADIDAVFAHGTGTPQNDENETRVIRAVFGARADAMPVPALKSMVGHGLGAAAGLTAVAALVCLEAQRLHPTLHLSPGARDPACDLDHVTEGARATDLRAVVLNAFGFGGKNACVVLTRAS